MAQERRTLSEQEFTAIRDRVLDSLPANLTEPEFNRLVGPAMEQALAEAEYTPAQPEGSAVGRFASNAAAMLNPIEAAKGIYQAVRHPVQTVGNIASAQLEQGRTAVERFREGRPVEGLGHAAAGVLPLLGPVAANVGEQGARGDVAGMAGATAGLLAPALAVPAVRAVAKRVGSVASPARREAAAAGLEQRAAKQITDVMSPQVGPNKVRLGNKAEKIAPKLSKEMADAPTSWTREGWHGEIAARLTEAEQALDAAADARLSARTFATQPILDDLIAKRKALVAEPVEASHATAAVTEGVARGIPTNLQRNYALRWMKDEMESFPFNKRTLVETTRKGSDMEVVGGSAGARIYRAIVGEEGREWIKAGRADVLKAINDAIDGKVSSGKLRKAVEDAADDLVKGGPTQKMMETPGPNWDDADLVTTRWKDISGKKPAPELVKEGVPIGEAVTPGPFGEQAAIIDRAIAEVKRLGPVVRYDQIKLLRQAYDEPAKARYNPSITQDFLKRQGEAKGAADVTGTLRQHLAKMDPATAEANAGYSLFRSGNDVMEAIAEVERTRPKVGRRLMGRLTAVLLGGQAGGATGAVAGAILGPAMESTTFTTKLARAKLYQKLADAIRKGDEGHVASLASQIKALPWAKGAGKKLTAQGGITVAGLSTDQPAVQGSTP